MSNASRLQQPADIVAVWITDLIEADYVRREVFPDIRKEKATGVDGSKRRYSVTRETAAALLSDAWDMSFISRGKAGVGLTVAYSATRSRLSCFRLKEPERHHCSQSEDLDALRVSSVLELMKETQSGGAALPAGTRIFYFREGDEFGHPGITTEGFRYFKVKHDNGSRIDPDGSRFEFRPGYSIKLDETQHTFFVPAHRITLDDCKPSHLRLVR